MSFAESARDEMAIQKVRSDRNEPRHGSGCMQCALTRRAQTNQDYIEFLNAKQSKLLAAVGANAKTEERSP